MTKSFSILLMASAAFVAGSAQAETRDFHIAGGSLKATLDLYARQSGRQVIYRADEVSGATSPGANGAMEADRALDRLLAGTGFAVRAGSGGSVAIVRVGNGHAAEGDPPGNAGNAGADIVVTALKVAQRLQDVPAAVSVLKAQALLESNKLSLRDYFSEVPGLTFQTGAFQTQFLSIRGINNQIAGLPTVAVLLDDAPLSSQVSVIIPDIDPDQISRIEVLKGPQGTLYGASTMGGLLKYVTRDPSTSGFAGSVQAGISGVGHGGEAGYNVRGNINLPVSPTLALRAGGFDRRDPGYIDNLLTGQKDVNAMRVTGANVTALWRPLPDWSLKINGLYQHSRSDGATNDVDTVNGGYSLTQSRARNSQLYDVKVAAVSGVVKGKIGGVSVTDILAYNHTSNRHGADYSSALGGFAQALYGVGGVIAPGEYRIRNLSDELRFNGRLFDRVDWTVGGFYTKQHAYGADELIAEDPVTGAVVPGSNELLTEYFPNSYEEYAVFADATVHLTDKLDVELGGRKAFVHVTTYQVDAGLIGSFVTPESTIKQQAWTYTATATYKFTPDQMVYARIASGFRAGGFNNVSLSAQLAGAAIPPTYDPDKTVNYEIGFKGSLFDGVLHVDLSAYYVDWKAIQLGVSVQDPLSGGFYSYTTNAGKAKSAGVEMQLTVTPWRGGTIQGWFDYDDAVLKSAFPSIADTVGAAGDRLPFNAKYSGDLSLRQDFALANDWTAFGSVAANYLGSRRGRFQSTPDRQVYKPYTTLQAAIGVGKRGWSATIFVNNITNAHGEITGGIDYFPPANAMVFIQPRTFGMNLRKSF